MFHLRKQLKKLLPGRPASIPPTLVERPRSLPELPAGLRAAGRVVAERFELEQLAGRGGFGEVWRARDLRCGTAVALKLMRIGEESAAARFSREAEVLAALEHPCIVRHLAHGATDEGELYLAMEWLDGEDLLSRLRRGALPLGETFAVVERVALALSAAHSRGVVHRDLKPGNIFLPNGAPAEARLLDFGIARLVEQQTLASVSACIIGTPGYMSPEQARGEENVDARTDVFALGCVFYECLTGEPPFPGENLVAKLTKVLFREPTPLERLRHDVPEAVASLVSRMLHKSAAQRPADGAAVVAELGCARAAESQSAGPASARLTSSEQRRLFVAMVGVHPRASMGGGASDSTPILPAAGLDDRRDLLRPLLAGMGARLERLVDGSLVSLLSAPDSATDAAARAASCALALRDHFPGARIALATGRGVVEQVLPLGEAIDRAASLLSAEGGRAGIAIDEGTAGLLDARFQIERCGANLRLLAEGNAPAAARTLLGKPTPFVGRDRELSTLVAILDECTSESVARAALVSGPPGQGKSRLRCELVERARETAEVWLVRGDVISARSPLGLLGQLVRGAAGVLVGEELEVRRRKLRARIGRHLPDREAQPIAEILGALCGVPSPEKEESAREARPGAAPTGDQVRAAFEQWLRAECAARPVLIVLEDLHWGDPASVKQLDRILRELAESPLFVLALARPEIHDAFPNLWSARGLQEMRLPELSRKASEKLARHVLGEAAAPQMITRVTRLSAGNAFYLEELLRAVAEQRGEALPETVLAMVQIRYEALDPEARRLLRAASILGEVFWKGAAVELLGAAGGQGELEASLQALVERELIERRVSSRFNGEEEFAFRHALLREGAYAALTEEDRRLGHRLAARWLQAAGEGDAAAIAEHLRRAGDLANAADWYQRAAEQALRLGDGPPDERVQQDLVRMFRGWKRVSICSVE